MKKLRPFLISATILLAGYVVVKACAEGDWNEDYSSNIAPEIFVDTAYAPFFYSGLFYYDISHDNAHDERFNEINITEWQTYLGKEMKKEAIAYLLTKADYATIKSTYGFYDSKNVLPDSMKRFNASLHASSEKERNFLKYLTIAKACENFAADLRYSWQDGEAVLIPKAVLDNLTAATIQKLMAETKDPFIKERYWFQLVRYNFFHDLPRCASSYEDNEKNFGHTVMYYRTMAYAAGAYYKQKKYSKANYYFSLVYSGNDALKTVAHWSFHPQEEQDWQQTLSMCANNKERITLWQMLGIFYGDEMRSMKEIYKLDPKDSHIDLLLTRYINRTETDGKAMDATWMENYKWIKKITDDDKISNPFLWNVTTGYLAYLKDDFATAASYNAIAEKKMPPTILAKSQMRLILLLNKVEALKTITSNDEQSLVPELQWLYHFKEENAPARFRYWNAQESIKNSMAKKYKAQGDLVKSECFVSDLEFYAKDKNVNDLKAYFAKANPTPFDLLCRDFSEKTMGDLWEYQAVLTTYKDDLDQAIALMGKADKNNAVVLLGNPFNGKINDCHDCDHGQVQKTKYTKLSFLQKMKELKDNVTNKNDVYNNALLLGNGYYNISHFGNARFFYEGAVIGSGQSSPYSFDSLFKTILTDNTLSTKYYRLALQNATNEEQKAKCLYMIAKCQRNDWYNKVFYNDPKNDPSYGNDSNIDFITWNAFSALRKYQNTQYYKDVIQECGYFRTAMEKL